MAGGSSQVSRGSVKSERLAARDQIHQQKGIIDNLFIQSQEDQMNAVDSAISGAQAYASEMANAKTAGQGMGASSIDGTMGYVMKNLIPQAMQMKAGIYGNVANQRAQSLEQYLQLLNQNASLGSYSKSTQKPNYLGSAVMGAAMMANPMAGLLKNLFASTTTNPTLPSGSPVNENPWSNSDFSDIG